MTFCITLTSVKVCSHSMHFGMHIRRQRIGSALNAHRSHSHWFLNFLGDVHCTWYGYTTSFEKIMAYVDAITVLAIVLLFNCVRLRLKHERDRRRREKRQVGIYADRRTILIRRRCILKLKFMVTPSSYP